MKKILLSLCLAVSSIAAYALDVTLDNIHYELKGRDVIARAKKAKELVNVQIPSSVSMKGRFYPVTIIDESGFSSCKNLRSITLPGSVKEIGKGAFKGCRSLETVIIADGLEMIGEEAFKECKNLLGIIIPNSVKIIGKEAFWDCIKLESAVLPDAVESGVTEGSYGFGRHGIFKGCLSLRRMRGTTMRYPQWMMMDAIFKCKEIPIYNDLLAVDPAEYDKVTNFNAKFSEFTRENYLGQVEEWQRRKGYETVAQWESRVNDQNRKTMLDEAIAESRAEFLKTFTPPVVKGNLEEYDAENQIFPIYMGELGTIYASVPKDEADNFKIQWRDVKITPTFGIVDDGIGITNCTYEVGEHTYQSPRNYMEDDFDQLMLLITPLASLREYEAQLAARAKKVEEKKTYAPDVVDIEIPAASDKRNRTFAVIIGNENYQRVAKVDYAQNDARVITKYFTRTLGLPEENVRTYYDATYGDIVAALEDIKNVTDAFNGDADVIFYYAGHGLPDESNRSAYLLPIDANGTSTETCYPVSKLYEELGKLKAHHTVALLDACFSGSLRGEGMLASARGIKLRPKEVPASGNLIVFSAASGDQTAFPFEEKNHGLFSYYLIKKMKEDAGDVNLRDLADYVRDNVSQKAVLVNQKPQTPTVKWSDNMSAEWESLKLGGEWDSVKLAPKEPAEGEEGAPAEENGEEAAGTTTTGNPA